MQPIAVFPDISKIVDFWWKNADASRTLQLWEVTYLFFWILFCSSTVPSFINLGFVWQIIERGAFLLPPIREQPRKDPSWIGLMKTNYDQLVVLHQLDRIKCFKVSDLFIMFAIHQFLQLVLSNLIFVVQ